MQTEDEIRSMESDIMAISVKRAGAVERRKEADAEYEKEMSMTLRQRWENNIRLKEHQKEALERLYKVEKDKIEAVFLDYWNALLDEKVINLKEFCEKNKIERKPDKKRII